MARRASSSIEQLGVQELVGHLLESSATYDEIIAKVQETTGKKLSRPALSRYRIKWADAEHQLELARQDFESIKQVLDANPKADFTEAAMTMLLGKLVRRFANAQEAFETVPLDKLSHLLVKVARSKQTTEALALQRERLELVKTKVESVAKDITDTVKAQGLSDDVVAAIKRKILEVVPA